MKNEEFRFRSVNSIVMAPAKTGRDRTSKTAVTIKDQTNSGIRSAISVSGRIL